MAILRTHSVSPLSSLVRPLRAVVFGLFASYYRSRATSALMDVELAMAEVKELRLLANLAGDVGDGPRERHFRSVQVDAQRRANLANQRATYYLSRADLARAARNYLVR